jgi:hypothetical protein
MVGAGVRQEDIIGSPVRRLLRRGLTITIRTIPGLIRIMEARRLRGMFMAI